MEKTKKGKLASKALMMGTALVTLNALSAAEAVAASGTGAMSASILTPIVVSGTQTLVFGDVTEASTGTVVIDTAGAQTVTGGVTAVNSTLTPAQGVIQIQAGTGVAIDLSMAAATFTVTDGGGNNMNVNGFNIGTAAAGANVTVTLAAATETRALGATLNVGSPQTPGLYTGNYTVNANYQ